VRGSVLQVVAFQQPVLAPLVLLDSMMGLTSLLQLGMIQPEVLFLELALL
jgi:hypothetical protein